MWNTSIKTSRMTSTVSVLLNWDGNTKFLCLTSRTTNNIHKNYVNFSSITAYRWWSSVFTRVGTLIVATIYLQLIQN